MSGVLVVGAAAVRLPHVLAPVGALAAPARQPQPGVIPVTGDGHGARVLGLGLEFDGTVPDVLPPGVALGLGRPEAAGEQEQQSGGLGPHGVRRMLSAGGGGEWNCRS